ncbi:DDE-type integrase/transposase/recombinase [Micrococcus luteus]|uniref:DDE-type integrase/transposase/recombinase n=1 Tax=Micrococcus luteus TaxID=1270 RepID=UPI0015D6AB49
MATRTAWRLCQANGWHSAFGTKPGKNGRRPGPPVHDDRVKCQFTAQGLNQLWLTGITEHPTGEGKLYLCAIKDLYAGRIVGYSMAGRMQASLAVDALHQAVARRGGTSVVAGCVVHSDRGWQGGFNRSSQHPQNHWRYKRWPARTGRGRSVTCPRGHGGSGERIGPCGPRCARPAGRSPHGRSNASFGG